MSDHTTFAEPVRGGAPSGRIALVVLALVVALAAGVGGFWYSQQNRNAAADADATAALKKHGVTTVRNPNTNRTQSVNMRLITDPDTFAEAWPYVVKLPALQSLDITGCPITSEQLALLQNNRSINSLQASSSGLKDGDMAYLTRLPIEALHVGANQLTTAGLKDIAKIKSVSVLTLSENDVGDDLSALQQLPNLEWLLLGGTTISDTAMEQLGQVKSLTRLSLAGATVSEEAVKKLKVALPNLSIDE